MDLEQPQSPQTPPTMDGPVGLGGWMVLPLLGLVAAPIALASLGYSEVAGLAEVWSFFSLYQKSTFAFIALILAALFVAAPLALLVFAFKRLEVFPGLFILWLWALPIAAIVIGLATFFAFRETTTFADVFDRDTIRDVGQSVVQGVIWTLYMNHSRRVQNTFVN